MDQQKMDEFMDRYLKCRGNIHYFPDIRDWLVYGKPVKCECGETSKEEWRSVQ